MRNKNDKYNSDYANSNPFHELYKEQNNIYDQNGEPILENVSQDHEEDYTDEELEASNHPARSSQRKKHPFWSAISGIFNWLFNYFCDNFSLRHWYICLLC